MTDIIVGGECIKRCPDVVDMGKLETFIQRKRLMVEEIPEPDDLCERNKGHMEGVLSMCDGLEELLNND